MSFTANMSGDAVLHSFNDVASLDPSDIKPSRWANRHGSSFLDKDFSNLKTEISDADGNVQPIKVRPVVGGKYEIVYGHRRHRACLELGLKIKATIEALSDLDLWNEMERENRFRKNLSPFEQGRCYKQAIDGGLFSSIRRLAESIEADHSQVAKVIKIASLPSTVLDAFATPNDIQVNWSSGLTRACETNLERVEERAGILKSGSSTRMAKYVYEELVREERVELCHRNRIYINDELGILLATITPHKVGFTVRITANLAIDRVENAIRTLVAI